jgi:hypothetical protein
VINAGGLINVYGSSTIGRPTARRKAGEIYDTLLQLFELAREQGIPRMKLPTVRPSGASNK